MKKNRKQQDEIAKATLTSLKHKGAYPKRRFERSSFNKKTYTAKDSIESEKSADKWDVILLFIPHAAVVP